MPSQNVVAVMSAMTAAGPAANAAAGCPLTRSALATSISAGRVTTTGRAPAINNHPRGSKPRPGAASREEPAQNRGRLANH